MPRQHYRYIENLQAEEIVKQKGEIIAEMANNMGVPEDKLLEVLYRSEAARKAKAEVKQALNEDASADQAATDTANAGAAAEEKVKDN